jgi:hypothetical protein
VTLARHWLVVSQTRGCGQRFLVCVSVDYRALATGPRHAVGICGVREGVSQEETAKSGCRIRFHLLYLKYFTRLTLGLSCCDGRPAQRWSGTCCRTGHSSTHSCREWR